MIPNTVMQLINRRFGINANALQNINSPDDMAQYLLNTGKVNQNDVNQARQRWSNDPQIRQNINNNFNYNN